MSVVMNILTQQDYFVHVKYQQRGYPYILDALIGTQYRLDFFLNLNLKKGVGIV